MWENIGSASTIGCEYLEIQVVKPREDDADGSPQSHKLMEDLCWADRLDCVGLCNLV